MLNFIYNDRQYTWDEWNNENKIFVESLELPDDFNIDQFYIDFVMPHDVGYSIAMSKIVELYHMIASSRFALITAHQKYYESSILSSQNPYVAHQWMRSQYLKNSAVWYNSCEDYIYQALWFAYDIHQKDISDPNWYKIALKNCSYNALKSKLEKNSSTAGSELLGLVNDYRFCDEVIFLREHVANNLKHHANIQFKGLERIRTMGYTRLNENKDEIFNSIWITPTVLDIDETIYKFQKIHSKLINFARKILDFMDIYSVFDKDEEGNYLFNSLKDKKSYKKVIF